MRRSIRRALLFVLVAMTVDRGNARASDPPPTAPDPHADPAAVLSPADQLWHHRNLGKAFYENPTTQYEAVEEWKKALALAPGSARDRLNYGLALLRAGKVPEGIAEFEKVAKQDPSIPHTWFNLGIALKQDSRYEEAIAKFETMAALVPDEPVTRFNLGTLYKLTGKPDRALASFEEAARLAPELAGPHYQLWNAYRAAGRTEDAARELALFRLRRAEQEGAAIPEDLEWSRYSEIYDEPQSSVPTAPAASDPAAEPRFTAVSLAIGVDAPSATLALLDADGDGRPDLLVGSKAGVSIYAGGTTRATAAGLEDLRDVLDVAPGDFDDDGRADLAIVTGAGVSLFRNAGGPGIRFERFAAALPKGSFRRALWLDADHDYDLDLLLLGKDAVLVRNPGAPAADAAGGAAEGWTDRTASFPFVAAAAVSAVAFHAVSDTQGMDVAVAYADRPGVLYRDRLGGRYEAEPLPALPALAPAAPRLTALDADGDGWIDLAVGAAVLKNDRGQRFVGSGFPASPAIWIDDLGSGLPRALKRNAAALTAADFNGDGRIDVAEVAADGTLSRLENRSASSPRVLPLALEGVKNLKLAPGAEVEVKSGALYSKQTYRGVPLLFGLGARAAVDTVRVTWPNGMIQNETKIASRAAGTSTPPTPPESIREAPRLSGSCPMIFTWNGARFEFVSDVLGVAPLGASAGDGVYFPVDHDEHVKIPRGGLVAVDGRYEMRITEELREVTYLDQVRLLAIDHPPDVEVLPNDRFEDPPFTPFALYGIQRKLRPIAARDDAGTDVLAALLAVDHRFPDAFPRNATGVAAMHRLVLDFGSTEPGVGSQGAPPGRSLLVLTGWVDWADGSTFLAAAQRPGGGLALPRLEVQDERGFWVTAVASMGIPAGKPKSIVVDLTGKWASAARKVRISTNLCVYWDEIYLSEGAGEFSGRVTELAPAAATLRFRGFSRPVVDPERKQPEGFDYQSFQPVAMWNPTPGLYTRYGEVAELLDRVDDRFVIFGSGDEIRIVFDAAALPAPPVGWQRDLIVQVDGWAKDADANTAFSQTVLPLPFHGMSAYPYPATESYPTDPEHQFYRRTYNTRPALRLISPLLP